MDAAIRIRGLIKDYGPTRALAGVDLEVERGQVFGFLGPNGAGKSTTDRILVDLLRPTAGVAEVLGQDPRKGGPGLRSRIGYLPGELVLQGRMTAGRLLGDLARLRNGAGAKRIKPLAERFALDLNRPIRALSKGNKQKVGVIQAFMHEPELLILDEPTSGLDPLLQREFRDLVAEVQGKGATVFLSSHVLSEVEDVADLVGIIRQGKMVDVDDVATLRQRAGQRVSLAFAEPIDPAPLEAIPNVDHPVARGNTFSCVLHGEPDALLKAAARHRVVDWTAENRELEDLFLDYYRIPAEELRPQDAEEEAHAR